MAFCKYCGSEIAAEAAFCPECGKNAPTGGPAASPLTAQESTSREPLSRREFCSTSFSPDIKKRVRTNWIAFVASVVLRIATICLLLALQFPHMPGEIRMWYLSRLVFNAVGVYLLLLLLTCVFKHRGLAFAATALAVYFALPIKGGYTIWDLAFGIAHLVLAVVVLINTLKMEKEYRAYLEHAFPGRIKSRTR